MIHTIEAFEVHDEIDAIVVVTNEAYIDQVKVWCKQYDLGKIKEIPIILVGGEKDKLSTREDIKWLRNELKDNVIFTKIVENMGHLSFMVGKDFTWFDEILQILLKEF